MSTARHRLWNVMWGTLGGVAGGALGDLVLHHGQMNVWFLAAAVAAGAFGGLCAPVRRAHETHWSGLLEWCFDGTHAVCPRPRA